MKQRSLVWILALLSLTAGSAGWCQEPQPAAPAAAGAKLVYKFRPGGVYRYHYSANGTVNVDLSHTAEARSGELPRTVSVDIAAEYEVSQRVRSVDPDGSAH